MYNIYITASQTNDFINIITRIRHLIAAILRGCWRDDWTRTMSVIQIFLIQN